MTVVDLFAGPGGWDYAARQLGLDPIGVELDADTCATRAAAGLHTIRAHIGPDGYRLPAGTRIAGLIASPPCQAFSAAGSREGAAQVAAYIEALEVGGWAQPAGDWHPDLHLLRETVRWATDHRPTWIAFEQVRAVLPFWHSTVRLLRSLGWSCWAGLLNAADYGAPQCRTRAILIAHWDRPVSAPLPTHSETPDLFGSAPWVSMAAALDLPDQTDVNLRQNSRHGGGWLVPYHRSAARPSATITSRSWGQWLLDSREHGRAPRPVSRPAPTLTGSAVDRNWTFLRPATTIAGDLRCWPPGHKINQDDIARYGDRAGTDAVRLTIAQAAALQTFPTDWPWQGTKTSQARQIGNAVPPVLARAVLAEVAL